MSRSPVPLQVTGNDAGEVVSPLEPNEYPLHDIGPNREASRTSEATTQIVDADVNTSRPPTPPPNYEPESIKSYPIKVGKWQLRRRNRPFLLLLIYFPLLIIPWILTCVLRYQPLQWPTYFDHSASLPPRVLKNVGTTMVAIRILNSIVALITVSVISVVLAYAAVVFTQKRKSGKELNLAQTFSLANRDWADLRALWLACRPCPPHDKKGKKGPSSRLLWIGFALLFLGAIQHPLQQLLVSTESLQVATCLDSPQSSSSPPPGCGSYTRDKMWQRVGYDPRPSVLQLVPANLVVQDVTKNLIIVSGDTVQANLWVDDYVSKKASIGWEPDTSVIYPDWSKDIHKAGFFTTSVPTGTTTGVLREHTMRMNSVVECSMIDKDKFPAVCPGSDPFTASFSSSTLANFNASSDPSLNIRICSPGNQTQNPWLPLRDRQAITEELFIDTSPLNFYSTQNFTLRCHAETARGYFELGNTHNGNKPGPVLGFWPDVSDINAHFDDNYPHAFWNATKWDTNITSFENEEIFSSRGTNFPKTPGPLQTTAIALFGNASFIANLFRPIAMNTTAAQAATFSSICSMDSVPYARLSSNWRPSQCQYLTHFLETRSESEKSAITYLADSFIQTFATNSSAQQALGLGMFYANRAVLTYAANTGKGAWARTLRSSPGTTVLKPRMTFGAMITVSVLIGVQVIGLLLVAIYVYKTPTWTGTLDARALAAIGAGMVEVLPKERLEEREWKKVDFRQADGVLGDGPGLLLAVPYGLSERTRARARNARARARRARHFEVPPR